MTLEELQAELDKANGKIDALVSKNAEILDEKKKLEKKYKEVDADDYFKVRDEFDALQSEYKKLEQSVKAKDKDIEALTAKNGELGGSLNKLLIDDGIAKVLNSLEKHKLNEQALPLAMLDIKSQNPVLVDGVAMVGDKPLAEYISTDWVNSPTSRNLITPNENSGGGANGGANGNGTPINTAGMSATEMMKQGRK